MEDFKFKKGVVTPNEPNTTPNFHTTSPLKNTEGSIQYGGVGDDANLLAATQPSGNGFMRVLQFIKTLTVEPAMFSFFFGYFINMACLSNMMMDKGCTYYLKYNESICQNLSAFRDEKTTVETLANNYTLYSNLMSLIAATTMIFVAPWSDKYGRKFPLMLTVVSVIFSDCALLWCTYKFESDLYYLVLAKIPSELFGGMICVMTIVFSHASEVSTEERRTLKYTTVEISFGLGMSTGLLTGGLIYRYYGYFYVYLTGTVFHMFCFFWILLFLQETTGLESKATWGEKVRDIFVCESLLKGLKASMRKRENRGRTLILLYFASMCVIVLTYESFGSLGYVFVHHIYNWDPASYSIVSTTFSLSQMLLIGIALPFLIKVLKVSDPALGIMGSISMVAKNVMFAFAAYGTYIYYIGNACGYFTSFLMLAVRSGISKIVDKDELGRVFSFLATLESVFPLIGTIFVTKLFNATINIIPNISYLLTSVFLILPLTTFVWAYRRTRSLETVTPYKSIE